MKRLAAVLSLLALFLVGCSNDTNQSGNSNTDSQTTQPPVASPSPSG